MSDLIQCFTIRNGIQEVARQKEIKLLQEERRRHAEEERRKKNLQVRTLFFCGKGINLKGNVQGVKRSMEEE